MVFPKGTVAPLVGAWIETMISCPNPTKTPSPLSWGRGLKLMSQIYLCLIVVAPLVGAWIETKKMIGRILALEVAPLVGAWIET